MQRIGTHRLGHYIWRIGHKYIGTLDKYNDLIVVSTCLIGTHQLGYLIIGSGHHSIGILSLVGFGWI